MAKSSRGRKLSDGSKVHKENAALSIDNPFRDIPLAEVELQASDFANLISPGDPALVTLFSRAALVAQQPYTPHHDLTLELTEQEKYALQQEKNIGLTALSQQTKAFKSVLVLLCLSAITQGWTESIVSRASLTFFDFTQSHLSTPTAYLTAVALTVPYVYSFIGPLSKGCIGHRAYISVAAVLYFTAGIVGASAVNMEPVLASRVLFGVFLTVNSYMVPRYVVETVPSHLRPLVILGWQATDILGVYFGFLSPAIIDEVSVHKVSVWRWQLASVTIPALFLTILMWLVPESPLSLLKQGRHQSAFDAMCLLRTTPLQAARDLFYASAQISSESNEVSDRNGKDNDDRTVVNTPWYRNKVNWSRRWNTRYALFTDVRTWRALCFACVMMFAQQILGLNVLMFYFGKINSTYQLTFAFTRPANGFSFARTLNAISIMITISLFGNGLLVLLTTRAFGEKIQPDKNHNTWEAGFDKQHHAALLFVLLPLEFYVLILAFFYFFTHRKSSENTGQTSQSPLNSLSIEELNYIFDLPRSKIQGFVEKYFWILRRTMPNSMGRTIWKSTSQQGQPDIVHPMVTTRASGSEDLDDYYDRNLNLSTSRIPPVTIEPQMIGPQSLGLHRVLITIQKRSIVFHEWTSAGWLDRCLNHVEQRSTCKWNWWPLAIPSCPLYKCDIRVKWTCHCGRQQYQDVPKADGKKLQQLNDSRSSALQQGHPCNKPRPNCTSGLDSRRPLFSSMVRSVPKFIRRLCGQGEPSRNVPVDTTGDSRPSSASKISSETIQVTRSSARQGEKSSSDQLQRSNFDGATPDIAKSTDRETDLGESSLRLVFGTEGRKKRSLSIDQLRLAHYTRDHDAISCMLVAYQKLRGCYKYWFSIFKLETFAFTRFVKHGRRKVYRHEDRNVVPEADPDYEYTPGSMQPPCHERPPVHRSEFMCLLDVCPKSCLLGKLRWHECNEPSTRSHLISRLPKKKTHWELENDDRSFAWGLECSFEISALRVLLWHVIIVLACFGSWTWLEMLLPKLAHSAGVPLALVTVGISAFWASAGILQPYNERPKDSLRAYGQVQAYNSYIHQGDIITTTFAPDLVTNSPAQSPQSPHTPDLTAIEPEYMTREPRERRELNE